MQAMLEKMKATITNSFTYKINKKKKDQQVKNLKNNQPLLYHSKQLFLSPLNLISLMKIVDK